MKIINCPENFELIDSIKFRLSILQKETEEEIIVSYINDELDGKNCDVICIGIKNINRYDIIYYAYTDTTFSSKYAGFIKNIDDVYKFMNSIKGVNSTSELKLESYVESNKKSSSKKRK